MVDHVYTLGVWHVEQRREAEFIAAWKDLGRIFASLPQPPSDKGLLIQSTTDPTRGTDAEKIATFDAFAGNSGTYEVTGKTITTHAMIGKNEYIAGATQRAEFRIEGNTLFWTTMMGGTKAVQKLIRLE